MARPPRSCRARLVVAWAAAVVAVTLFPATAAAEGLLQVATTGSGAGKVVGDSRAFEPIDCPSACRTISGVSRVLTLTAIATEDSSLGAWNVQPSGAVSSGCGQSVSCTVFVGSAIDTFEVQPGGGGFFVPHTSIVNVTATFIRNPDGVFLCYSKFQADPGIWRGPEATTLSAGGYWRPYAIPGTRSSTRLGAFALVCNLPPNAILSDRESVDDGGSIITGASGALLGLYPVARL
jgi:hypothetical protein